MNELFVAFATSGVIFCVGIGVGRLLQRKVPTLKKITWKILIFISVSFLLGLLSRIYLEIAILNLFAIGQFTASFFAAGIWIGLSWTAEEATQPVAEKLAVGDESKSESDKSSRRRDTITPSHPPRGDQVTAGNDGIWGNVTAVSEAYKLINEIPLNHLELKKLVHEATRNRKVIVMKSSKGNTLLHLCASSGEKEFIRILLDCNAATWVRNSENLLPADCATDASIKAMLAPRAKY